MTKGWEKGLQKCWVSPPLLVWFLFKSQPARKLPFLSRNLPKFPWFQKQAIDSNKHKVPSDFAVTQKFTVGTENARQACSQKLKAKVLSVVFPGLSQKISSFSHLCSGVCQGLDENSSVEKTSYCSFKYKAHKKPSWYTRRRKTKAVWNTWLPADWLTEAISSI